MDLEKCKKLVSIMEQAYTILRSGKKPNIKECEKWLKFGEKNVHLIEQILKNKSAAVSEKMCLISVLGLLKMFQGKIKQLRKKGEGVSSTVTRQNEVKRIIWQDLESAFENRIITGSVVNLVHKDMLQFLNDSK